MCRAVFPFLVAALTLAPRLSSSLTTFTWPSLAARWRAFSPFALLVLISMLPLRYSKTFSRLPARAARKKLAFPSVCCCKGELSVPGI
uniref:Uncharacterized protein n=1 Tax=Ixodes ricinus TaxID=34613 RepID=A0A147BUG1_IXORI